MEKLNEFIKLIQKRRTIRSFTNESIDRDILETIMESGIYAPSARNLQSWHFSVITNPKVLEEIKKRQIEDLNSMVNSKDIAIKTKGETIKKLISKMPSEDLLYNAPCLIVVSAEMNNKFSEFDCGLATENILLAAESYKYSTCISATSTLFLASESQKEFKTRLKIPNNFTPITGILLGKTKQDNPIAPDRDDSKVSYIK
ncbi:nitroreductase family protein [Mycoplasma sp. P36-A1]|uniref:nitroreductase family protein n=1 Tax=Mycoplasma sp. P36-A1 TaxID=3252900 RepID=UPI003C2B757A